MAEVSVLYIISGHGGKDVGACGNGYKEYERVRALAKRIMELGGKKVMCYDMSRDCYADNGISKLSLPKGAQILELHMDCFSNPSAHGGHVVIKSGFNPDEYDKALAKFISDMFPGRAQSIVKRSDLANPNRAAAKGYSYRLMECGFISNANDVKIFNANIDKLAEGILKIFGIEIVKPVEKPKEPAKNDDYYRVQVGAFKNKAGAETLKQQLKKDGYDSIIV